MVDISIWFLYGSFTAFRRGNHGSASSSLRLVCERRLRTPYTHFKIVNYLSLMKVSRFQLVNLDIIAWL